MELGFTTKPERMNLLSARPQHDTFGIDNAMLVFPGDPDRSILHQRMARRGGDRCRRWSSRSWMSELSLFPRVDPRDETGSEIRSRLEDG